MTVELSEGENKLLDVSLVPVAQQGEKGLVYGYIHLEGNPPEGMMWVRSGIMEFIQAGLLAHQYSVTTDTAGIFRIQVDAGTYDICVKFPRALSRRVNNVTIAPGFVPTNVDFPTLIEGDANNDDIIDVLDMILIDQSMGLQDGDPGFNDDCDFNRDGVVDQSDMDIEAAHSGQVGDCHGIG